jgi:phytoene dehydrogenase-like protein
MWALTRRIFVEQPVTGLRSIRLLPHPLRDTRTIAVHRTLRSFNSQLLSDQRLIRIAEYFAKRIGSDPRNMPASAATETFVEQNFGSLHVSGGMRSLADALYARCVDLDVRFEFNSTVAPVVSEGKVRGVRTRDGDEIRAEFVVVNDDNAHPEHEVLVLLAVAGKTDGILHHNVWFGKKSQGELSSADISACVPNDQYMSPPDAEAWCLRIPYGDETTVNLVGEDHNELIDAVVNELAERGCDLRGRVLWSTTVTPSNTAGSHRSRDLGRFGQLRAPQNITPIEGMFTVGPSVHPGPGLSFVAIGANIVAEAIGSA